MDRIEFFKTMVKLKDHQDHDAELCGNCRYRQIMSEVAEEMLTKEGTIDDWHNECEIRWKATKFYKLWNEERAAGRDPHVAFSAKGWEP